MQSLRTEVLYCAIMHGNHNRQLFNHEAKGRSLIIITMKKRNGKTLSGITQEHPNKGVINLI